MTTLWPWIALSLALLFGTGIGLQTLHSENANAKSALSTGSLAFASSLVVLLAQPIGYDKGDAP